MPDRSSFTDVFQVATTPPGEPARLPYPYQVNLACGEALPDVLDVPTGLGKTEAVVLAWLWRRHFADEAIRTRTPRRLVWCLPMRVLVEQTRDRIRDMLSRLGLLAEAPGGQGIAVSVLMGGEDDDRFDLWPERDAVLVGTQDLLLSRALNRGWGLSRFRWPAQAGLLNGDALWVLDEVQLMGNGLPSTLQLDAFRRRWGGAGPAASLWMSATVEPERLTTVDAPPPERVLSVRDSGPDAASEPVRRLLHAQKPLTWDTAPGSVRDRAAAVAKGHRPGTLTLVVVNTVDRACVLFDELRRLHPEGTDLRLAHSRFRPAERRAWMSEFLSANAMMPDGGRILVSTQVVEAGVDLSAATLFTEQAPWASLVQRFGRCNRRGEFGAEVPGGPASVVVWAVDEPHPYDQGDLDSARLRLERLVDVGPASLGTIPPDGAAVRWPGPVLRRKDMLDLFDTTPDLTGNDVDVQPFVREGHDADVALFWRSEGPNPEGALESGPLRDELCPVPVGLARDLVKKSGRKNAFLYDAAEGIWKGCGDSDVRPGREILILASAGGYDPSVGFTGVAKRPVPVVPRSETPGRPESHGDDRTSTASWQSIADHSDRVVRAVVAICRACGTDQQTTEVLKHAARWHDRGKAHPAFQARIPEVARPDDWKARHDVAKAPDGAWTRASGRPHLRHELASALAALDAGERDLVAFLVATHHGKVRLTLRSLPSEPPPADGISRICRGIHDGDRLPAVDLGGGQEAPEVTLALHPMEMGLGPDGHRSWADRMLSLRDDEGIWRLLWLEAILRAADGRASAGLAEEEVFHG